MPRPANILHDASAATQTPIGSSSPPATIPASSTGKFRYISDTDADERLQRAKAAGTFRSAIGTAYRVWTRLRKLARSSAAGCVETNNGALAQLLGLRDRNTVGSALTLLQAAGLLAPPVQTHGANGYVTGLRLAPISQVACAVSHPEQLLLLKSSTAKSSALHAPPRPLTPATMKFVQVAAWETTNEHLAAKDRGADVPDNLPDIAQAVRGWLAEKGATAAETDIRAALDHVDRQRRRQQALPLIGVVARGQTRQAAPRTTIAGAPDLSLNDAWARYWAAIDARCG